MRLDNNAEEKADNHDHNFVGVYSRKAERFMQLEGIIDLWTASVYPAYEIFIGSSSEYVDLLKNSVDNKYIQEGIKEDHITFF